jgi:hypothetical protein
MRFFSSAISSLASATGTSRALSWSLSLLSLPSLPSLLSLPSLSLSLPPDIPGAVVFCRISRFFFASRGDPTLTRLPLPPPPPLPLPLLPAPSPLPPLLLVFLPCVPPKFKYFMMPNPLFDVPFLLLPLLPLLLLPVLVLVVLVVLLVLVVPAR